MKSTIGDKGKNSNLVRIPDEYLEGGFVKWTPELTKYVLNELKKRNLIALFQTK